MIYQIQITQVYRVVRTITIEVDTPEDEGAAGALEQVESGSIDTPAYEDARWKEIDIRLQEEHMRIAK